MTGYVLAGGKSSRMGRNKALLELGGKPLAQRAVETLQAVCAATFILSSCAELAVYAPLVPDVHPGCGPLGGMEAALLHTTTAWNLFLAVDMPFVPEEFLGDWMREVLGVETARIALFTVSGVPQPALCMVHRDASRSVQAAVSRGEYRVLTGLRDAAEELAAESSVSSAAVLLEGAAGVHELFTNVNTPQDFALAQRRIAHGAS